MQNAFSIDVEDYFQVNAFADRIPLSDWDQYPSRVVANTTCLLDLLAKYQVQATFFTLGWVAERFPDLVKTIAAQGHEVASHGYHHQLVYRIGPEKFREDIRQAKKRLEDLSGQAVLGYRAPSYSITQQSLWALDILTEEGYRYDSSIFPIVHDTYGIPGAQRFPYDHQTTHGLLREFPMATKPIQFFGKNTNIPIAGGGYLRFFPITLLISWLRSINQTEKQPFVMYLHPWEIDPEQPRLPGRWKSRFRHYLNLDKMYARTEKLLQEFSFAPVKTVLFPELSSAQPAT